MRVPGTKMGLACNQLFFLTKSFFYCPGVCKIFFIKSLVHDLLDNNLSRLHLTRLTRVLVVTAFVKALSTYGVFSGGVSSLSGRNGCDQPEEHPDDDEGVQQVLVDAARESNPAPQRHQS